jgi:hypothetical protein
MKTTILILFIIAFFLKITGCSSRQHFFNVPRDQSSIEKINRERKDFDSLNITIQGINYPVTDFWYTDSGIFYISNDDSQKVDYGDLNGVRFNTKLQKGRTMGPPVLMGMLAGIIIGANQPVQEKGFMAMPEVERTGNVFLGMLVGSAVGLATGAVIWGISDKRGARESYHYIFEGEEIVQPVKQDLKELETERSSIAHTVEFSSIIKKGNNYIIISWQRKNIHLHRSEYKYRGQKADGTHFIVVPDRVFIKKFQ